MTNWKILYLVASLTGQMRAQTITTYMYKSIMVTDGWWDSAKFEENPNAEVTQTMCSSSCSQHAECQYFKVQDDTCQLGKSDICPTDNPTGSVRAVYAIFRGVTGNVWVILYLSQCQFAFNRYFT